MKVRWPAVILCSIVLLLGIAVAVRLFVRRSWDKRVSDLCYAGPQVFAGSPLVLSNADWKMRLAGVTRFREYPEPDAIVLREHSTTLVWDLPLICSVPEAYRTSWDSYALEFTFSPNGERVIKCHHGSD
ncbi:MAG TPA: hypothetical protein VGR95_12240 [Thermoanaerobaculia bacterium]|nr:hypothetical protein [Thermoanaerobaculia bacterium]